MEGVLPPAHRGHPDLTQPRAGHIAGTFGSGADITERTARAVSPAKRRPQCRRQRHCYYRPRRLNSVDQPGFFRSDRLYRRRSRGVNIRGNWSSWVNRIRRFLRICGILSCPGRFGGAKLSIAAKTAVSTPRNRPSRRCEMSRARSTTSSLLSKTSPPASAPRRRPASARSSRHWARRLACR